jgi:hypothetical protein
MPPVAIGFWSLELGGPTLPHEREQMIAARQSLEGAPVTASCHP